MFSEEVGFHFSLRRKMGSDSAVLTSVGSSFHHCGARTEKRCDRVDRPERPLRRGNQSPQGTTMYPQHNVSRSRFWEIAFRFRGTFFSVKTWQCHVSWSAFILMVARKRSVLTFLSKRFMLTLSSLAAFILIISRNTFACYVFCSLFAALPRHFRSKLQ